MALLRTFAGIMLKIHAALSPVALIALVHELPCLAAEGQVAEVPELVALRSQRNSLAALLENGNNLSKLYDACDALDTAMRNTYLKVAKRNEMIEDEVTEEISETAPGNFHGIKSHSFYVGAIADAHPALPFHSVQSIVASEWYHPGLSAKAVWCTEGCGKHFPLARRLDESFGLIRDEVEAYFSHQDAVGAFRGVGSHTTQFDKLIAGNGTWVDVRLWRGRFFNRELCELHFRVVCAIIEASPEIWTNPWSHVLISVLMPDSWVPFHQGHTNAQLTYHLPVRVPVSQDGGSVAELAVVQRGGSLRDEGRRQTVYSHAEETIHHWREGHTLVFDDSFTHAVRFRGKGSPLANDSFSSSDKEDRPSGSKRRVDARVVLLMRGWHPELPAREREALRSFLRRGGEEEPPGYDMLPITDFFAS